MHMFISFTQYCPGFEGSLFRQINPVSIKSAEERSSQNIGYKILKWNGGNGYLWGKRPQVGFHYIQYLAVWGITRVVTPTKVTTKHGSTEITIPRMGKVIIISRKSQNKLYRTRWSQLGLLASGDLFKGDHHCISWNFQPDFKSNRSPLWCLYQNLRTISEISDRQWPSFLD